MKIPISVVGLGKLGACMAAAIASKGFPTVGVDVSERAVELINRAEPPVYEPGLGELLLRVRGRLRATRDFDEAISQTEATFIVVPTPSLNGGAFSLKYVVAAARSIGEALRKKSGAHLVGLCSTVLPGSTEFAVKPALEQASGKPCGKGFGLCYSPEFIALGSVVRDFLNPDFALIGETSTEAGERLASIYKDLFDNSPPVARMSAVNAELAKIAVNTYVTAKITFANLLAEACEHLPGGDIDAVTSALGLDTRIGRKYLRGAVGYGGTCFPRDNMAFSCLLEKLGISAELPRTVDRLNRRSAERVAQMARDALSGKRGPVAVLGLAYKPATNVVEESQGIAVSRCLASHGIEVLVYDPAAMEEARRVLKDSVKYADSMEQCLKQAEVLILTTPWPEFRTAVCHAGNSSPKPVIIDGWRHLEVSPRRGAENYIGIGLGEADAGNLAGLQELVARILTQEE